MSLLHERMERSRFSSAVARDDHTSAFQHGTTEQSSLVAKLELFLDHRVGAAPSGVTFTSSFAVHKCSSNFSHTCAAMHNERLELPISACLIEITVVLESANVTQLFHVH